MSRAVVSRLPGTGSPPVEADSSGASPSRMVRAVMATSRPALARAMADALPMPRLAPVTSATRRSTDMQRDSTRTEGQGLRSGQLRAFSRRLKARRRRRSRSFVPAQYPTRSGTASAYRRHSARTVQRAHSCLARAVGPPRSGMNISTRSPRHAARVCHLGRRSSCTTTDETLSTSSSLVGWRADSADIARLVMSRLSALPLGVFSRAERATTLRGHKSAPGRDPPRSAVAFRTGRLRARQLVDEARNGGFRRLASKYAS